MAGFQKQSKKIKMKMSRYKNKKIKNSIKVMHSVVNDIQCKALFKSFYLCWASSIMANALCRRQGHPSSIPGSSKATIIK